MENETKRWCYCVRFPFPNVIGNRLIDIGGEGIQDKGFIVDVIHLQTGQKMGPCGSTPLLEGVKRGGGGRETGYAFRMAGMSAQGTMTTRTVVTFLKKWGGGKQAKENKD
jgi:hypothetical protein